MAGLVAMLLPLTAAGQWRGWVVAKGGSTEGGQEQALHALLPSQPACSNLWPCPGTQTDTQEVSKA